MEESYGVSAEIEQVESATVEVRLKSGKVWRFEVATTPDRLLTFDATLDTELVEGPPEHGMRRWNGGRTFVTINLVGRFVRAHRSGDRPQA
jgi:hypothetical protein